VGGGAVGVVVSVMDRFQLVAFVEIIEDAAGINQQCIIVGGSGPRACKHSLNACRFGHWHPADMRKGRPIEVELRLIDLYRRLRVQTITVNSQNGSKN
jgi:hypothetical protein